MCMLRAVCTFRVYFLWMNSPLHFIYRDRFNIARCWFGNNLCLVGEGLSNQPDCWRSGAQFIISSCQLAVEVLVSDHLHTHTLSLLSSLSLSLSDTHTHTHTHTLTDCSKRHPCIDCRSWSSWSPSCNWLYPPRSWSDCHWEKGLLLSKQCPPSLAIHNWRSQAIRSKEILWKVLCWSNWSH